MLRWLNRMFGVHPEEYRVLGWAWSYIFCLLASYYILRPIRDEMGVSGGVENLQWLFTGTLAGMLAANPTFAALVARLPRARFIAVTYRFFIVNLLLFALLFKLATTAQTVWIGRVFFIWVSVFNLFVVSVFWELMVDVFDSEQSKRLFGFIAAGATMGGIVGSSITAAIAKQVPVSFLLLGSAAVLELSVLCVRRMSHLSVALQRRPEANDERRIIGGSALSGVTHAMSSPYLIHVGVYILLFSITSTFLYFQQADIVRQNFVDRGARTAFFARIDLWVNVLTLGVQLFLTRHVLRLMGVGLTLAALPALSIAGFGSLAAAPSLAALVTYQILRRAGNFALARPAREVLFTVVPREDKYKAKNFIDTVVYRIGDQIGAWCFAGLGLLGIGLTGVSVAAVPFAMGWLLNGLWLGRRQKLMAAAQPLETN